MAKKNHQWKRVVSTPDITAERREKNKNTKESRIFQQACESVGIEPTKRQASKWNNKKGLAYKGRLI